jgi:hypothetical protein
MSKSIIKDANASNKAVAANKPSHSKINNKVKLMVRTELIISYNPSESSQFVRYTEDIQVYY